MFPLDKVFSPEGTEVGYFSSVASFPALLTKAVAPSQCYWVETFEPSKHPSPHQLQSHMCQIGKIFSAQADLDTRSEIMGIYLR